MKDDDTKEILPNPIPLEVVVGPPIDDPCQGLPAAAGEYIRPGTRNADGTCSFGSWVPK